MKLKREVNPELIDLRKAKYLILLNDLKDILKYTVISMFFLLILLSLGWYVWAK